MRRNLAARAGSWSAGHWKAATFGWLAFVVAAVVLGGAIGTKKLGDDDAPGESGRMWDILEESFARPAEESVLVQSRALTIESGAFVAAVGDVVRRVSATGVATGVRNPSARRRGSDFGRWPLGARHVRHPRRSRRRRRPDRPCRRRRRRRQGRHPEFFIGGIGDATADKEISEAVGKDLERAGLVSLPVTMVVLVVAFGALVAAGIPLLLRPHRGGSRLRGCSRCRVRSGSSTRRPARSSC